MAKILGSDIDNSRCVKRGILGVSINSLTGYLKKRHNPLGVALATLATPLATPLSHVFELMQLKST